MRFKTIPQTARDGIVPEYRLRIWHEAGKLPGFYSGKRFYVDTERLYARIESECEQRNNKN